jgi:hypothetical protein
MPDPSAKLVTIQVSHKATTWAQVSFLRCHFTNAWHMGP